MNTVPSKQTLSYVEQTALVLLGMGEDAAAKVLQHFSRDETQRVTRAMAKLNGIKSIDQRRLDYYINLNFRKRSVVYQTF